jgi:hypothetical protein
VAGVVLRALGAANDGFVVASIVAFVLAGACLLAGRWVRRGSNADD